MMRCTAGRSGKKARFDLHWTRAAHQQLTKGIAPNPLGAMFTMKPTSVYRREPFAPSVGGCSAGESSAAMSSMLMPASRRR